MRTTTTAGILLALAIRPVYGQNYSERSLRGS